jgi:hypothetical protein
MSLVFNNQDIFQNCSVYNINTKNKHHHHRPNANLCFQKSTFSAGIKILNSLSFSVTILKNDKAKFQADLRKYLHTQFFYSVDQFLICKDDLWYCFCKMCFSMLYNVHLYILSIYDLFHILLSLWHTYGPMECMYVQYRSFAPLLWW